LPPARVAVTSAAPWCGVARPRRPVGATSATSHGGDVIHDVIIYNLYSHYTVPFQSAPQPSEIVNSSTHIFLIRP